MVKTDNIYATIKKLPLSLCFHQDYYPAGEFLFNVNLVDI